MSIRLNTAAGLLAAFGAGLLPAAATAQTKLLRFPDIAGDRVAFCYAGDIWTAPAKGGNATRLTAHPGLELFPKFSPDGKWIAFTGQYEGDEQVYVDPGRGRPAEAAHLLPGPRPVPAARRLRQPGHGLDARRRRRSSSARSATPTASARRASSSPSPRRAAWRKPCPCPRRARATSRPTASGSSTRPSSATSAPGSATRAAGRRTSSSTTSPRTTRSPSPRACAPSATPCGSADAVYFASDRDGTLNLYSWDLEDRRGRQAHDEHDVGRALAVVRQRVPHRLRARRRAARLRRPGEGRPGDLDLRPERRRRHAARRGCSAEKQVEGFELSPKGERALFVARGDVFTAADREGPDAQPDRHLRRPRQAAPAGRPTARGSRSSPTAPARTRSGSWTRRAASRSS